MSRCDTQTDREDHLFPALGVVRQARHQASSPPLGLDSAPRGSRSSEEWEARGEFLSALVRVDPERLSSLWFRVGYAFEKAASLRGWPLNADECENNLVEEISISSERRVIVAPWSAEISTSYLGAIEEDTVAQLRGELRSWAHPYLEAEWVHEVAIYTLHVLTVLPGLRDKVMLYRPFNYSTALRPGERDLVFVARNIWEPTAATRGDATGAIRERFNAELEKRLDQIQATAKERGFRQIPVKRERDHFDWTVRLHILGETIADIARDVHRSRETVSDAVNGILPLLALPTRPKSKGGHPRKVSAVR